MALGKIRIEYKDGIPRAQHVYLNDVDIGRYVRNISFSLGVDLNGPPVFNIEIIATPDFVRNTEARIKISKYDPLGLFGEPSENRSAPKTREIEA